MADMIADEIKVREEAEYKLLKQIDEKSNSVKNEIAKEV